MKKITLLMCLLLTAFAVFAQDTIKLPETLIPTNETQTTSTVKFPAVTAQKGCRVILKGRFFYKGEKVSGWNLASSIKSRY